MLFHYCDFNEEISMKRLVRDLDTRYPKLDTQHKILDTRYPNTRDPRDFDTGDSSMKSFQRSHFREGEMISEKIILAELLQNCFSISVKSFLVMYARFTRI